jgi:hypothetical protein
VYIVPLEDLLDLYYRSTSDFFFLKYQQDAPPAGGRGQGVHTTIKCGGAVTRVLVCELPRALFFQFPIGI